MCIVHKVGNYMHSKAGVHRIQKRVSHLRELEFQVVGDIM